MEQDLLWESMRQMGICISNDKKLIPTLKSETLFLYNPSKRETYSLNFTKQWNKVILIFFSYSMIFFNILNDPRFNDIKLIIRLSSWILAFCSCIKWLENTFRKLKADRPHPHDYLHTPTDYRHTEKHFALVMTLLRFWLHSAKPSP